MKTIDFQSKSQAGQDRFVYEMLVKPENLLTGTFVDIGACHPIEISNTYALEQLGWRGLLVDNDPGAIKLCKELRQSPAILADATAIDWSETMTMSHWTCWRNGREEKVPFDFSIGPCPDDCMVRADYLSLDIDAATLPALRRMPLNSLRFRVLTVEHDVYRFGEIVRDEIRRILSNSGYDLVCADVCSSEGIPYEDWLVHPSLSERAHRFRCQGKRWPEIFANIASEPDAQT